MRYFGLVKPDGEIRLWKDTPWRRRMKKVPEIKSGSTVKLAGGMYHYLRAKSFHTWNLKRTLFTRSKVFTEIALWRQGTSEPLDLFKLDEKPSLFSAEVVSNAVESSHIMELTRVSMQWKDILLIMLACGVIGLVGAVVMLVK